MLSVCIVLRVYLLLLMSVSLQKIREVGVSMRKCFIWILNVYMVLLYRSGKLKLSSRCFDMVFYIFLLFFWVFNCDRMSVVMMESLSMFLVMVSSFIKFVLCSLICIIFVCFSIKWVSIVLLIVYILVSMLFNFEREMKWVDWFIILWMFFSCVKQFELFIKRILNCKVNDKFEIML